MIDALDFHPVYSTIIPDKHLRVEPIPKPDIILGLLPNLPIGKFVDVSVVQSIKVTNDEALDNKGLLNWRSNNWRSNNWRSDRLCYGYGFGCLICSSFIICHGKFNIIISRRIKSMIYCFSVSCAPVFKIPFITYNSSIWIIRT